MEENYTPNLENIKIIKMLYKTKLSKVWIVQNQEDKEIYILKGRQFNKMSQYDINCIKRERNFLEKNNSNNFPKFKKALKDQGYIYLLITFFEGLPISSILNSKEILFDKFSSEKDFQEKNKTQDTHFTLLNMFLKSLN